MLSTVREEIQRAAKETGVMLAELAARNADKIRHDLLTKYGKDHRFEFCCDNISDYSAVQHPEAWTWIQEFLGNSSALLFYDSSLDNRKRPDRSMFRILSGSDLTQLLEECYGFVFYVTNDATDYVLCFNEHDYLIGAGGARGWTDSLLPRHYAWAKLIRE